MKIWLGLLLLVGTALLVPAGSYAMESETRSAVSDGPYQAETASDKSDRSDSAAVTDPDDCEDFSFDDLESVTEIPECDGDGDGLGDDADWHSTDPETAEVDAWSDDWDSAPGSDDESDPAGTTVDAEQATPDEVNPASAKNGPKWWSVLPPIVAIAIALIFRQVLFALFIGVWMGAWLVTGLGFSTFFSSFFTTVTGYIVPSVADPDHVSILVFSLLIGGTIGIIGENGGTRGIVRAITRLMTNRRRAQTTTTAMGYLVFFDDYANTMVVGSTMRPLTDRLRISRAKLAYLVDSTAAPVAIVALISTWVGAVVGYIHEAGSGIDGLDESAYLIFLNSLPYNFYAFLAIIFVAVIALSGRDFGPMRRAEQQALNGRDTSKVADPHTKDAAAHADDSGASDTDRLDNGEQVSHWLNAALPILGLVGITMGGLWITGEGPTIQEVIGSSDSYAALVWGSVFSLFLAILMTLSKGLLTTEAMLKAMYRGMHLMFEGLIILVLAWSLGMVTQDLQTPLYLVSLLEGVLDPYWIPALIFILAGVTSFATGSSWGTMGILTPLVLPLTWTLSGAAGLDSVDTYTLVYASVSAVLAGAVWGDHCSPISDTTILSSLACRCDHITHVNTQLPYALTVGGISVIALVGSMVIGIPVWVIYPVAILAMIGVVYRFGSETRSEAEAPINQ